jgi:cytochrome c biogenesis protein CcmG/thiol:disulfide interchange protein DsbE
LTSPSSTATPAGRSKLSRLFDGLLYLVIAGLFALLIARSGEGPEEGAVAAPFSLKLVGSEGQFQLDQHRGKPVLMEVLASWCGACESAAPMLRDVHREATENGVVVVGVSIDQDAREAEQIKQSWGIPYPLALDDGSVKRGYGVSLVPTFVLIDRDGTIKRVSSGVPSRRTLSRWLTEL